MASPLIAPNQLLSELDTRQVFDIRWKLNEPDYGHSAYLESHIPGAVFVDLDADLSGRPGPAGRHPLPSARQFEETLGRLGIDPSSRVVVYDDVSGMVAARMWWMLQAVGHMDVSVLDGGLQGWIDVEGPLETDEVPPIRSEYQLPHGFHGVVQVDELDERTLLDVRAEERYLGKVEPVDPRPGHIPGAINLPAGSALAEHKFRPAKELADLYAAFSEPVVSCGSGVVACHTALAMVTAGYPMPEVYVGSYSEWSTSDRPVHKGSTP